MMIQQERKYLFSVIIPIYNIDQYLDEALQSITNQSIGFEENIQLILVNDGSTDDSADICRRYQQRYPDNVVYIEKENGGVSSARNEGIEHIRGKYVNFFDGDDKWDLDAFTFTFHFFEKHYDEIDVVSGRLNYFGRRMGFINQLDYKYDEEGVADIEEKPSYIQLLVNSVFIKAESISELRFDTRLRINEDAIFISKIILEKGKYGILPSAVYYYRKRDNSSSASDNKINDLSWYFDTLKYCYKALFEHSIEKYGKVIPYCQYLVMYFLQVRLKKPVGEVLSAEEKESYEASIVDLLKEISKSVIMKQKNINSLYKIFALNLKYGKNVFRKAVREDEYFKLGNRKIFNVRAINRLKVNLLDIEDNMLLLEGTTQLNIIGKKYALGMIDGKGKFYRCQLFHMPHLDMKSFTGKTVFKGTGFRISVKMGRGKRYKFVLKEKETGEYVALNPQFGQFAKLSKEIENSYYAFGKYIVKWIDEEIVIAANRKRTHFKAECRFLKSVLEQKKYKIALYRVAANLIKAFKKKEIWIVSDRTDVAKDNGKVLSVDSFAYKLRLLYADKIIFSSADEWTINAFEGEIEYVKDLYKFSFVFLQHGIIQDDLSSWIHKQNKNISLFIMSTEKQKNV